MKKKYKIAIVCNSIKPDLVEYFKCKIECLEQGRLHNNYIAFKNRKIILNIKNKKIYNSSFSKSAFFDEKIFLDFFLSFYLIFIIIIKKVKIIHFTTAHISNLFLSVWLKFFKIKQIFTIHDLTPHPSKKAIFIKLYNKLVINFLANEIISFSKRKIETQINKWKFRHFFLSGFKLNINEPKTGQKIILFFGRIESYKGLENLLDIITMSYRKKLDYRFIIAGKGKIINIEKFKKLSNVEIINRFINDKEIFELFKKATFVLLPYNSATQSGVIILSYSYATPVIAYDVGALGEYIEQGKTGFIVKYKDNDTIINILETINNDEILSLSQNCILYFKERYSKEAFIKMYSNYYESFFY